MAPHTPPPLSTRVVCKRGPDVTRWSCHAIARDARVWKLEQDGGPVSEAHHVTRPMNLLRIPFQPFGHG